jgi:glycosyltransferase involved in cell wall biosynthesis
MRILIASDAWRPQINGVVRTLGRVTEELGSLGHRVRVVGPSDFPTVPCPTYPGIRLAAWTGPLPDVVEDFAPEAVHIATEGPIGLSARRWCRRKGVPFTTSFHTKFPEYFQARVGLPPGILYAYLRWFHGGAVRVMATTDSMRRELEARRFARVVTWCRGVDADLFKPVPKNGVPVARPLAVCVGRVAVEKNLRAFLDMPWEGGKMIVGGGPQLEELRRDYPSVHFTGEKTDAEVAALHAEADVFVFPSRTDTFGLVMLEAMASGVPVAAYPVAGPVDVVTPGVTGVLDENLSTAARAALALSPADCRDFALKHSWRACAEKFLSFLEPFARPGLRGHGGL